MPHRGSAVLGWFVKVFNEAIKEGLDRVAIYLDDVIVFDADLPSHKLNMKNTPSSVCGNTASETLSLEGYHQCHGGCGLPRPHHLPSGRQAECQQG